MEKESTTNSSREDIQQYLEYAMMNQVKEVHDALQKNMFSIDVKGKDERTALMLASAWNAREVVEYLLRRGADSTLTDSQLVTALHLAAENDATPVLSMLIGHVTPVSKMNAQDRDGYSPLHITASEGFYESTKVLLLAGAQLDQRTFLHSNTPLDLAMEEDHQDVAFLLRGWDISWCSNSKEPASGAKSMINQMRGWSTQEVGDLFLKEKFPQYLQLFEHHSIKGSDLLELTEKQLQKIGITNPVHQVQILQEIQRLQEPPVSTQAKKVNEPVSSMDLANARNLRNQLLSQN